MTHQNVENNKLVSQKIELTRLFKNKAAIIIENNWNAKSLLSFHLSLKQQPLTAFFLISPH